MSLTLLLGGCEGEKDDPNGVDNYFKNNAYSSADRTDPLPPTLEISPVSAQIGIVGQEVAFTVSGGVGGYRWYLANEDNGELIAAGANQAVYICKKVGNNDVTAQDEGGHYAVAHITPDADEMTITPSSASLSGGARYVAFTVNGGTPPYAWTVGNASLGTVSYSSSTSYTVGYTAVSGAYGQNTITVRDADGRVAVVTVTQSQ